MQLGGLSCIVGLLGITPKLHGIISNALSLLKLSAVITGNWWVALKLVWNLEPDFQLPLQGALFNGEHGKEHRNCYPHPNSLVICASHIFHDLGHCFTCSLIHKQAYLSLPLWQTSLIHSLFPHWTLLPCLLCSGPARPCLYTLE